jgi:Tfp pilus assembly protein PilV
MLCNKKGFGMVEVLIAMFITMISALSLLSMIPMAWSTSGKSDYFGRATGLMQDELEWRQYQTERGIDPTTLEYPAGGKVISVGNVPFTVKTITTPVPSRANTWLVNVNVIWTGNNLGVTSSMMVTRQMGFNNNDNS